MYETTRQRVCKWLLLAVLVFSTLDAALFALFDIGMERLGLRCLNSFFEYYLPEFFPGKLTVYVAAFADLPRSSAGSFWFAETTRERP